MPLEQRQLHRDVSQLIRVMPGEGTHRSYCVVCARRQWERWDGSTIPFADGSRLIHRLSFIKRSYTRNINDLAPSSIDNVPVRF